jgi:hypothetical protein
MYKDTCKSYLKGPYGVWINIKKYMDIIYIDTCSMYLKNTISQRFPNRGPRGPHVYLRGFANVN